MKRAKWIEFFNSLFGLLRPYSKFRLWVRKRVPRPIFPIAKEFNERLLSVMETVRIQKSITGWLGREFPPPHKKIEIDITYRCNQKCVYCNRFIDILPSNLQMSVKQIKKFIKESIDAGRKWEYIFLSGGEPMLHPDIFEIVNLICEYKKSFSTKTELRLLTNGFNRKKILALNLPAEIEILNSKKDVVGLRHNPVMVAPVDIPSYQTADLSNGCFIAVKCAMGLNCYGYYQCTVAAAIDRVFGFDRGRKKLPSDQDGMVDLYQTFCGRCGHFIRSMPLRTKTIMTPVWREAISKYNDSKPCLTLY